jgi:protein arginine kinase
MADDKFYLLENKAEKKQNRGIDSRNRIILNTKNMLLRNLASGKFVDTSSSSERNFILNTVKKSVSDIKEFEDYQYFKMGNLSGIQKDLIFKEYMIDEGVAEKVQGRGLFIKSGFDSGIRTAIIINCEDHINIQGTCPGLNIRGVYKEVIGIEKCLEKKLSFAFDSKLGYLTASPFNLGTALIITVVAHLPALAISPKIGDFVKKINNIGCQISGYFPGQSEIIGNLFKISNRITLGKGEKDIIKEMQAICLGIIEDEKDARMQLKKADFIGIEDNIYRSFGLLKYAKILSYEEALELLSIIRLGLDMNIIDGVYDFDFFEMIHKITNSHIMLDMEISEGASDDRLDSLRAEIIRKRILKEVS